MGSSLISLDQTGASADESLVGHVLMLNTEKAQRFQCFGFVVTRNLPIQEVPKQAQQEQLRRALEQKILLDITGTDTKLELPVLKAINTAVKDGTLSKVEEGEQVGTPCIVGQDEQGNSYVIIPKDQEEYEQMKLELETTGHIRRPRPKRTEYSGLSAVYEEELPAPETQN